jgi:hypothetical protein
VFNDDRPEAPVTVPRTTHEQRAVKSANRERFLRESGYTILDDGPTKTVRVNRAWIATGGKQTNAPGGNNARWLLSVDDKPAIPAFEVLFLDETQTETEVILVTKQVRHGCTDADVNEEVRSAYMISTGRVAYRASA